MGSSVLSKGKLLAASPAAPLTAGVGDCGGRRAADGSPGCGVVSHPPCLCLSRQDRPGSHWPIRLGEKVVQGALAIQEIPYFGAASEKVPTVRLCTIGRLRLADHDQFSVIMLPNVRSRENLR